MIISKFEKFIPQNVALQGSERISVYNSRGGKVGSFKLQNLKFPRIGEKLYSFGALADVHIPYDTAEADFRKALTYLVNTENVAFTCVAGDITSGGTAYQFGLYKTAIEECSPNTPVRSVLGNHDNYNTAISNDEAMTYIGDSLCYSFTQGNDVFIMVSISGFREGSLFTKGQLQWLYETLETNRNKRCFVFHHVRPQDGCGNAFGIYDSDIWGGTEATVFENLMKHYKNAHQFHGHSHLKLNLQTKDNLANIDRLFGGWSIHIPSLAVPRSGDPSGASSRVEIYAEAEGYVVDVYKNHLVLRGRDFVKNEFIGSGIYCLDTKLVNIPANTFTDSTGTITV